MADTQCNYRLHRFGPNDCIALDAKVGESLFHKWQCDTRKFLSLFKINFLAPNYHYLIHDCYASSEKQHIQILDNDG